MNFGLALAAFVDALQADIIKHYAEHYKILTPSVISTEPGSRYVRIVTTRDGGNGQRSVHCFVRIADGVILKAAGWKAPFIAKGGPNHPNTVRGSIYAADHGMSAVSTYGANYVR